MNICNSYRYLVNIAILLSSMIMIGDLVFILLQLHPLDLKTFTIHISKDMYILSGSLFILSIGLLFFEKYLSLKMTVIASISAILGIVSVFLFLISLSPPF